VPAPLRINFDERWGHVDDSHATRHGGSDAQREVDIVHARYVVAGEDGLSNPRALLGAQRHAATSLTLKLALLVLTLLCLTLL
jgi:hypothetical protein